MIRVGITWQLLLSFLFVAALPLAGLSAYYVYSFDRSLQASVLQTVSTLASKKFEQINTFIEERLADSKTYARQPAVREALLGASDIFRKNGHPSDSEYLFHSNLKVILESAEYYDLLLIDAQGNVVLSILHEEDWGTNLLTGPFHSTNLAKGFQEITHTLSVTLTPFEPYPPTLGRPAGFAIAPIVSDTGKFLGALALQVNFDTLTEVITDRTGLGQSGETVFATLTTQGKALFTVPLRRKANAAFHFETTMERVALPMRKALNKEQGAGMEIDYSGTEVVAAWRYLPILHWGMVVKIDAEEALSATKTAHEFILFTFLVFFVLSALTAYLFGRKLSQPIKVLIRTTADFANGDLTQRVALLKSAPEFEKLGRSFNEMANQVAAHQAHLEEEVAMRTKELHSVSSFQKAILDNAAYSIIATTPEGTIISFNQAAERMLGYSAEEMIGRHTPSVFHCPLEIAARAQEFSIQLHISLEPGFEVFIAHTKLNLRGEFEWTYVRKDGSRFPVLLSVTALRDKLGSITGFLGIAVDLTERKQAEEALHLYARVFEYSGEAILVTDQNNLIVAVNPAFTELTGYCIEELQGKNPRILASGRTSKELYRSMWNTLLKEGFWQGELWDRRKDGSVYPKWITISTIQNELTGKITHYIANFTDISERKAAEERIERLAHHDPLTGLFNRFSLEQRLGHALLMAHRETQALAVLFLDMDRFKLINDTLGHPIGDSLLIEVAHRLQSCVRKSDIVARIGGDEFVVVLTGFQSSTSAIITHIAEKILNQLREPYHIKTHVLHSTPSIGISTYPTDGDTHETLIKNADIAMYQAKMYGKNTYRFFSPTMTEMVDEQLRLEHGLYEALEKGQFELHYQPQVRTRNGYLSGVEALLRWRHPEKGLITPDTFIPIAEESGLIIPLGAWVLDEACRQLSAWKSKGMTSLRVAVNLSAHQLRSPELLSLVTKVLAQYAIAPGELELEVTESVAMENPEKAISQLNTLRELGVAIAIDDFGTGYSSLAYLKLLPIQTLKLDRTFVRGIGKDENDVAISSATLALAHTLGLEVVAEGVETENQREFLNAHHCDFLQGYLFSKPMPADEATAFLLKMYGKSFYSKPAS